MQTAQSTCMLHHSQAEMFANADRQNHSFYFSEDKPGSNTGAKSFGSTADINEFIKLYMALPDEQKHCYELMREDTPVFEYYDLDVKLPPDTDHDTFNNLSLFMWFDHIRSKFIHFISPPNSHHDKDTHAVFSRLLKPNWIILTASDQTKLSLHLINTNAIFTKFITLRTFMNRFKSHFASFYAETTLGDNKGVHYDIDFSVYSKNRNMRIIHSTKLGSSRALRVWKEFHETSDIPIIQTFITNARNHPNLDKITIPLHAIEETLPQPQAPVHTTADARSNRVDSTSCTKYTTPVISRDTPVETLLSLLHKSRCDNRTDWLTIGMALKTSNCSLDVWDTWSQQSSKYDKDVLVRTWNSLTSDHKQPVTMGTIHYYAKQDNPEGYASLISKYKQTDISLTFTPDVTIQTRYIPAEIYTTYLTSHDILCVKSNLNSGKTHSMPTIFPNYPSIVVVYHRISLNKALSEKWKTHGFTLYQDIKTSEIWLSKHKRIIIQADSLPRLRGKTDLLILDELESLHEHICSSPYMKDKRPDVFHALKDYIDNTPKIIVADGTLKDETIDATFKSKMQPMQQRDKRLVKILNVYKVFSNKCAVITHNMIHAKDRFTQLLKQGKKIIAPSNSKRITDQLKDLVVGLNKEEFLTKPLKVLQIDIDHPFTNTLDWSTYDVVIYTPTITAGISFDTLHFDHIFGFFTNRSSSCESAFQQLFRARNTVSDDIYIYCSDDLTNTLHPITTTELMEFVDTTIASGARHLDKSGLYIDRFHNRAKKNMYYDWYINHLRKQHLIF